MKVVFPWFFCWTCRTGTGDFVLPWLVQSAQYKIYFFPRKRDTLFHFICRHHHQAGLAVVPRRLSLNKCLWGTPYKARQLFQSLPKCSEEDKKIRTELEERVQYVLGLSLDFPLYIFLLYVLTSQTSLAFQTHGSRIRQITVQSRHFSLHWHPLLHQPVNPSFVYYTAAVFWIRKDLHHFGNPDPDPHRHQI